MPSHVNDNIFDELSSVTKLDHLRNERGECALEQWVFTFPILQLFNTVAYVMATHNHKTIFMDTS